eukprot:1373373-Amphidinium_carterae.1
MGSPPFVRLCSCESLREPEKETAASWIVPPMEPSDGPRLHGGPAQGRMLIRVLTEAVSLVRKGVALLCPSLLEAAFGLQCELA